MSPRSALPGADRTDRVLKWVYRRHDEAVQYELGLSADDLRYELRASAPDGSEAGSVEVFGDAIAAFQRQAAVERLLVNDGWSLESFQAEHVAR